VTIAGKLCGNTYSTNIIAVRSPMVAMGDTDNILDGFVFVDMDDESTAKQKSPKQIQQRPVPGQFTPYRTQARRPQSKPSSSQGLETRPVGSCSETSK